MNVSTELLWKIFKLDIYHNYLQQKKIRELSLEEIKKIQWNRLNELLDFVYNFSDFYHENFKSVKLTPQDIKSYKDFQKLPIVNKITLKKNYKKIIAKGSKPQDYAVTYTSGSTGEPFSFLLDKKREEPRTYAAFMLSKENVGINPFIKYNELMIKAEPTNEIKNLNELIKRGISQRLKYYFSSESLGISSLNIKKDNLFLISSIIKDNNIKGLYGYSSNVFYLAKLFHMNNIKLDLKYVILIAEGILKQQKKFISTSFNCPVYLDYGASECMRMGFECNKHDGYHMDIYNYYFEYLDDNNKPCKPGENANIIVTNLNNYIFPLLRYNIGDQCIVPDEKSLCDLNYPVVSQITGRKSDTIKTRFNDEISVSNFAVFFEYLSDYINQYQLIVDEKSKEILIKIITSQHIEDKTIQQIKEQILKLINYSMDIKIELVETIPFEKNGKTKTLIIKQ